MRLLGKWLVPQEGDANVHIGRSAKGLGASGNLPPWLANAHWRQREVRFVHGIGFAVFALGSLVFGSFAFGWLSLVYKYRPQPGIEGVGVVAGIAALLLSVLLVYPLGLLIHGWMRRIRFGDSVCRLRTLPGVIGGWFKADVECHLPRNSDGHVVIRLINSNSGRGYFSKGLGRRDGIWRMEQAIDVAATAEARTVIPVRLKVPRDPTQFYRLPDGRFNPAASTNWVGEPTWILVLETDDTGKDYYAAFHVPVFDTNDAPASEQCAE